MFSQGQFKCMEQDPCSKQLPLDKEFYPSLIKRDPGTSWIWKQTSRPRVTRTPCGMSSHPPFLFIPGDSNTCPHPGSFSEPPVFFAQFRNFSVYDWFVVPTTLFPASNSIPLLSAQSTSSRQAVFSSAKSSPSWSTEHIKPHIIRLELRALDL